MTLFPFVAVSTVASFLLVFSLVFIMARRSMMSIERGVSSAEAVLLPYRDYLTYMDKQERDRVAEELRKAHAVARTWSPLMFLSGRGKELKELLSRLLVIDDFMDGYSASYATHQREMNGDFVSKAGLDGKQWEAVAKDDMRSLVLAPAGSGKTRCLTSRIAYLVEKGANPEGILGITYTKPATLEMQKRLRDVYGLNVEIRTLHSFARKMGVASPNYRKDTVSDMKKDEILKGALLDALSGDPAVASAFSSVLNSFRSYTPRVPSDHGIPTINGVLVKSDEERMIYDFLLLNGLSPMYEKRVEWASSDRHHQSYRPDFYLPEYDIYIEHWGIDRNGKVADFFVSRSQTHDASWEYMEEMKWKRGQFREHGKKLVETYHYEASEGTLLLGLESKLQAMGVTPRPVSPDYIQKQVARLAPTLDPFTEQMASFISVAKRSGFTPSDIRFRLELQGWSEEQKAFAKLMAPVWEGYDRALKKENMIDYDDMITCALDVAHANGPVGAYSHVLIDEYQDITDGQLQIVKYVLERNKGARLFCVGDDMQNIFSFAGSNVRNILDFQTMFPHTEITVLSTNYRNSGTIVSASVSIMGTVKSAIKKDVVPFLQHGEKIVLVTKRGGNGNYDEWEKKSVEALIDRIMQSKEDGETVMVLSRHNFRLNSIENSHRNSVEMKTVHKAKGKEADYVIILGVINDVSGFPPDRGDRDIMVVARRKARSKDEVMEEERRLWYVAVTRARKRLYILTESGRESPFLVEIKEFFA